MAGNDASVNREAQVVSIPVGDPGLLRTASRRLDESGVTVDELALRRSSLDEVFFALTGHPAEPEPDRDRDGERSST